MIKIAISELVEIAGWSEEIVIKHLGPLAADEEFVLWALGLAQVLDTPQDCRMALLQAKRLYLASGQDVGGCRNAMATAPYGAYKPFELLGLGLVASATQLAIENLDTEYGREMLGATRANPYFDAQRSSHALSEIIQQGLGGLMGERVMQRWCDHLVTCAECRENAVISDAEED